MDLFPPLPHVEEEARMIGKALPKARIKVAAGSEATKSFLFRQPLADYRMIHFAGHAHINENDPKRSGLLLAGGNGDDDDFLGRTKSAAFG